MTMQLACILPAVLLTPTLTLGALITSPTAQEQNKGYEAPSRQPSILAHQTQNGSTTQPGNIATRAGVYAPRGIWLPTPTEEPVFLQPTEPKEPGTDPEDCKHQSKNIFYADCLPDDVTSTPEPSSLILISIGMLGVYYITRAGSYIE